MILSYKHEGKRGTMKKNQPKRNARKDRNQMLVEYINSHDMIHRSDITHMSFREPSTALRNYTKKTGQTFIQVDYDTWTKGEVIDPEPLTVNRTPRAKYKFTICQCGIYKVTEYSLFRGSGLCRKCTKKRKHEKITTQESK